MTPGICFTMVPWWSWWRMCRPEWCPGSVLCCIRLPWGADLPPKVTFSKMEKPLQRHQKAWGGEMAEDLGSLISAPSLCSSELSTQVCAEPSCCPYPSHPHSVLYVGNTFRKHVRHAWEKGGFYAGTFSQHAYRETRMPSSNAGHQASPAPQPT